MNIESIKQFNGKNLMMNFKKKILNNETEDFALEKIGSNDE